MTVYVYIAEECINDAHLHSLNDQLEDLKHKVEKNQEIRNLRPIQHSGYYKKPFGKSYRLFALERIKASDSILCFLKILPKSYSDEKKWTYDSDFRTQKMHEILSEEELEKYIEDRKKIAPVVTPDPPSQEEREWLTDVFSHNSITENDIIVLETLNWIDDTAQEKYQHCLISLCRLLEDEKKLTQSSDIKIQAEWSDDIKVGFLYRYFPVMQRILLIKPIDEPVHTQEDLNKLLDEDDFLLSMELLEDDKGKLQELLQYAYRSYPLYIVADQDAWLEVQKNKEANLALSPEESDILASIKMSQDGQPLFPLFINGRAGSGKSTLLHYIMKDYVEFAVKQKADIYPCYLTYSENLLESAKHNIIHLLKSHHSSLTNGRPDDQMLRQYKAKLEKSAYIFLDLVKSTLPDILNESRFRPDYYISHKKFKEMWDKKFSYRPASFRNQLKPDICWHVIRTYIKGMAGGEGDFFDPEDYKALPRDQKTVTETIFGKIYNEIWQNWYKPKCEEGFWDDQDIVLAALEHGEYPTCYGAIICDESQDFTQIEIELIYHLSLFSRRSLYPHELRLVPFVFAGDPLQTLNPTGFRWESLRALFHLNIVQMLDRAQRARLEFNFKDLTINYRSKEQIVRFCNIILLMRAHLFDLKGVSAQLPWRNDNETTMNVSYRDIGHNSTEDLLRRIDVVKIVNCDPGEEGDFVKKDRLLSKLVQTDEAGIPMNVLSPDMAKGLEYDKVAVYGFGDYTIKTEDLLHFMDEGDHYDPDKHLPFEYFFNRLYVSVSRGKGHLYIVDNLESFEKFWLFARDSESLFRLARAVFDRNPDSWKNDNLFYLQNCTGIDIEDEEFNPQNLAVTYREHGLQERSPSLMRNARHVFSNIGKENEAIECYAYALEFEGNFEEAGRNFKNLHMWAKAVECYWKGRRFRQIVELAQEKPDLDTFKVQASSFMQNTPDSESALNFLQRLVDYFAPEEKRKQSIHDRTWSRVVQAVVQRIKGLPQSEFTPENWRYIYNQIEQLQHYGLVLKEQGLAEIAFRAGDYMAAIRLWDQEGVADGNYIQAKIKTEKFPQNLSWLAKTERRHEILREWSSNNKPMNLEAADMKLIFDLSCTDPAHIQDAFAIIKACPKIIEPEKILKALLKNYPIEQINILAVIEVQLSLLAEQGNIASVLSYTDDMTIEELAPKGIIRNAVDDWGNFKKHINKSIIKCFSVSQALTEQSMPIQKQVSDFLRNNFCPKPDKKILNWRNYQEYVPYDVAGAAIERAGRIIDALSFYDWLRQNGDVKEATFAQKRLIKCRYRRARALKEEGRTPESQKAEKELNSDRAKWQIEKPEEIEEYPTVSYIGPKIESIFRNSQPEEQDNENEKEGTGQELVGEPGKTERMKLKNEDKTGATVGGAHMSPGPVKISFDNDGYEIHFSSEEIRIDNLETFAFAKYLIKYKQMRGGDFQEIEDNQWYSDEWGVTLTFIWYMDAPAEVEFKCGETCVTVPYGLYRGT